MRRELGQFIEDVALTVREQVTHETYRKHLEGLDESDLQEKRDKFTEAAVGAGMISTIGVLTSSMGRGIDRFVASRITGRTGRREGPVHLGARALEIIGVLGFLSGTILIVSCLRDRGLVEMEQEQRESNKNG